MQVQGTTYSTQTMALQASGAQSEAQLVGVVSVDQTDRFEPSQAVMGAADALPGQKPSKFEVTGDFGFCQNCGASHGVSEMEDGSNKTSEVNGTEIPDLHGLLGADEAEAGSEAGEEEAKAEEDVTPETERDALTGEVELSEEEKKQVEELKRRDQEVRTHEHAHVAAGGQHVRGGISYEYQTGADGRRYAVGGEVSIDTSPESDPEDTIRKAQTIRQAALAPAEPSGQDRRAAAAAAQMELQARQEIAESKLEGEEAGGEEGLDVDDMLGTAGDDHAASELLNGQVAQGDERAVSERVEKGLPEARGVSIPDVPQDSDDENDGVVASSGGIDSGNEEKDKGLPEASAPSVSQPVTQLDYGRQKHAGGLVDVYG